MTSTIVLAGGAGDVLVAAAADPGRYAAMLVEGLARPATAPWGQPAARDDAPEGLPASVGRPDEVVLCGRVAHQVQRWAEAAGAEVRRAGAPRLAAPDERRVIAVSSLTRGAGADAVARRLARSLVRSAVPAAVVGHPLTAEFEAPQAARAATSIADLPEWPLEVTEAAAPHVAVGVPFVTGFDPAASLQRAAEFGSVIVWEGEGRAEPWVEAELDVLVVDLSAAWPGDGDASGRVARADVVVLTNPDAGDRDAALEIERAVRGLNGRAAVVVVDMPPAVAGSARIVRRTAVVVEDWRGVLLDATRAGRGEAAARRFRCRPVDPASCAVGSVADAIARGARPGVLPALGRTGEELEDFRASLAATQAEVVVWGSSAPAELAAPDERRVVAQVYADVLEAAGGSFQEILQPFLPGGGAVTIRRRRPT